MTEKFVRACDNVKDIKKVDFIMAQQSDLIHTKDGKEWLMNNGTPEQISGAVVSMGTITKPNKDIQVSFNSNKNGTQSNVGYIQMSGDGFNYDADNSIIRNKAITEIEITPTGSNGEGKILLSNKASDDESKVDMLGLVFPASDFSVEIETNEETPTAIIKQQKGEWINLTGSNGGTAGKYRIDGVFVTISWKIHTPTGSTPANYNLGALPVANVTNDTLFTPISANLVSGTENYHLQINGKTSSNSGAVTILNAKPDTDYSGQYTFIYV